MLLKNWLQQCVNSTNLRKISGSIFEETGKKSSHRSKNEKDK